MRVAKRDKEVHSPTSSQQIGKLIQKIQNDQNMGPGSVNRKIKPGSIQDPYKKFGYYVPKTRKSMTRTQVVAKRQKKRGIVIQNKQ